MLSWDNIVLPEFTTSTRVFRECICGKVYFDQLLDSQTFLLLSLHSLLVCHILCFGCWIFSIPSRGQFHQRVYDVFLS